MTRLLRRPLPFAEGGARHRIGVRPIEPAQWLEIGGDDVAEQVAEKARVFDAHRGSVLGVLPAAEQACIELRDLVRAQLPEGWTVAVPAGCHPLEEAGRLVPEDFCVHLPDAETGLLTLMAGCVCFPNRWSLVDKVGHPVTAIHEPVPRYDPQLARPVERLMARLPEGRILERHNWSVVESGELLRAVADGRAGTRMERRRQRPVAAHRAHHAAPVASLRRRRLHHPDPHRAAGRRRR